MLNLPAEGTTLLALFVPLCPPLVWYHTHALYVTDRLTTDPTDNKFRHEFELILIEETLLQHAVAW